MIDVKIIFKTSRKITIELVNRGPFFTDIYEIWLNGKKVKESEKTIETINGLIPDTRYKLKIVQNGEKQSIYSKRPLCSDKYILKE